MDDRDLNRDFFSVYIPPAGLYQNPYGLPAIQYVLSFHCAVTLRLPGGRNAECN
jgi:hypothetical protein